MSDADSSSSLPAGSIVSLDPFAFWPSSASAIRGLGGARPDPDPAYVFHTPYADVAAGSAQCTIRFADLSASTGKLIVRINALAATPNAAAEPVKAWTVDLRDLAGSGGETRAIFAARPGVRYAVLGHMYTESDARAAALDAAFETLVHDTSDPGDALATQKSAFGRRVFRQASRMLIDGRATLADPVSQACTASQFDEPVYAEWLRRIGTPARREAGQWEQVYILQALERYAMLGAGARGLGFGVGPEPLPAIMETRGCTIVATRLPTRDGAPVATGARLVDPTVIDDDLKDFDFVWSTGAANRLSSIDAGLDFFRNAIDCLKFGGLAVHTMTVDATSNTGTGTGTETDTAAMTLFRKRDIERVALDLVSRGHFVAQIKDDFSDALIAGGSPGGGTATTAFGLIVRRGDR